MSGPKAHSKGPAKCILHFEWAEGPLIRILSGAVVQQPGLRPGCCTTAPLKRPGLACFAFCAGAWASFAGPCTCTKLKRVGAKGLRPLAPTTSKGAFGPFAGPLAWPFIGLRPMGPRAKPCNHPQNKKPRSEGGLRPPLSLRLIHPRNASHCKKNTGRVGWVALRATHPTPLQGFGGCKPPIWGVWGRSPPRNLKKKGWRSQPPLRGVWGAEGPPGTGGLGAEPPGHVH